jgi:hypothetical protein
VGTSKETEAEIYSTSENQKEYTKLFHNTTLDSPTSIVSGTKNSQLPKQTSQERQSKTSSKLAVENTADIDGLH